MLESEQPPLEADGEGRGGDEDSDHSDLKVDNNEQKDTKGPVRELTSDEGQTVGDEGPIQSRNDRIPPSGDALPEGWISAPSKPRPVQIPGNRRTHPRSPDSA